MMATVIPLSFNAIGWEISSPSENRASLCNCCVSYDGSRGTLGLDIWMIIHRVATVAVTFNCWLNIQDKKSSMLLFRITWRCCIKLLNNLSHNANFHCNWKRRGSILPRYYRSIFSTKLKIVVSHAFKL